MKAKLNSNSVDAGNAGTYLEAEEAQEIDKVHQVVGDRSTHGLTSYYSTDVRSNWRSSRGRERE